jgi:uncharacterized integral membrane protein
MVRLIINIVFLIILAVFIALNAPYKTSVNIFGFKVEDVSVVAVIIVTLVIGVVYSFFFYASNYLVKMRKQKLKHRDQSSKQLAKDLAGKEENLKATTAGSDAAVKADKRNDTAKTNRRGKGNHKFLSLLKNPLKR